MRMSDGSSDVCSSDLCRCIGVRTCNECVQTAQLLRPFQRENIILNRQHGGRVDGFALENTFNELAALGHAEDFRQRTVGRIAFQPFDSTRRSEEHTSELQSLMRTSYAVFCLKKKKILNIQVT